jgi:hypothetical protein
VAIEEKKRERTARPEVFAKGHAQKIFLKAFAIIEIESV